MILFSDKIFIHIPKTSGTNFRRNIIKSYSKNDYLNYDLAANMQFTNLTTNDISKLEKRGLTEISNGISLIKNDSSIDVNHKLLSIQFYFYIKHFTLKIWQEDLIYKNQYVFTIVRNPYTRLVSSYENALKNLKLVFNFDRIDLKGFINNNKMNSFLNEINFIDYKTNQVDYLINTSGNIICDKFYKMETDQEQIFKDFNLPELNKSKHAEGSYNKNYSKIFDDELIDWVQKTYKRDFEYFGYDINPFWK
jgi:hypothetical protein